ncbi:MAG TPA: sigma-70 family RNA polymerase sigma factor [Verrucomicrobiae bacterium]|jgi:RNA polymerase sigma-70 factor, ECF subfamily|nr:sigma-70 family RNA polymerase sigma factor [Verrucomicrobiae bacterium]
MRSDIEKAVTLLRQGDENALEKAVELLQRAVFAFGMRVCGHREDAEDTMQEVLVKAIPYLPKFDNSRALAKWLYTVAKNRCLMNRRKSKFAPKQELSLDELMPKRGELEQLDSSSIPNPENSTIRGEQAERLREAIRALPPHYRIVLVLRDMEGFTDQEVGEITGLRPGTIRIRLHRARLFVRRELTNKQEHARSQKSVRVVPRNGRCRKMFAGLSDYLDGELDDFSCEEIEAHLEGCEPCKKFLDSLKAAIQSCQNSPADCPDREETAILRKQLLATYSRALAASAK